MIMLFNTKFFTCDVFLTAPKLRRINRDLIEETSPGSRPFGDTTDAESDEEDLEPVGDGLMKELMKQQLPPSNNQMMAAPVNPIPGVSKSIRFMGRSKQAGVGGK